MTSELQGAIQARAIEWHIRLRDGDDATWDAFIEWLAENPRHGEAYGLVEQTDLVIEPLLPDVVFREAANDDEAAHRSPVRGSSRWLVIGGALAASVAAVLTIAPQFRSSRYDVATGPGEHRVIALDATTKIILNGSTRMTLDRKDARFASLGSGEALFRVHHDSARPFRLKVGNRDIEDVGTVFNVVYEADEIRVAVAEGKIVYHPNGGAVPLNAGQALIDRRSSDAVRVARISVEAVGSWNTGRLVYSEAPLSQVAEDLARALGIRITVASSIADRGFSGTIALDGSGAQQLERLKPALNVALEKRPDGWIMKPAHGAAR